jgi:phosphoribosylformylglycinamidine (FGAM) synthase-like enzyme
VRPSVLLFGESTGRALVSFEPKAEAAVRASAEQSGVPFAVIGKVGGDRLRIVLRGRTLVDEPVAALRDLWSTAFARALESADVL